VSNHRLGFRVQDPARGDKRIFEGRFIDSQIFNIVGQIANIPEKQVWQGAL
jgi:hypothetical protein